MNAYKYLNWLILFFSMTTSVFISSCGNEDENVIDNVKDMAPTNAKAIDLSLPSGLKWANMNVGATRITDYGYNFAWGETKPKKEYIWETYLLSNGTPTSMQKYCTSEKYGIVDHKEVLEPEDDAAHVNWGGKWRMPTAYEEGELIENCHLVWTVNYNNSGVAGYIVYKAKSDSDKGVVVHREEEPSNYSLSDVHIFLPATAKGYDESYGRYWSSSVVLDECNCAWWLRVDDFSYSKVKMTDRYQGWPVRAVCE